MRSRCHAEGIGQGPPLPLQGGGRVINVLFIDICILYLIQNDNMYMFDVNGGNGGELACCW